jgi:hypothetical protein
MAAVEEKTILSFVALVDLPFIVILINYVQLVITIFAILF